jgi:hypothetical protein
MNRHLSTIILILLFIRGSLSIFNRMPRILPTTKSYQSSSAITDENNFSIFLDKCIFNPIFSVYDDNEDKNAVTFRTFKENFVVFALCIITQITLGVPGGT